MKSAMIAIAVLAFAAIVAAPAAADGPTAWCTLSYPATCQATVGDTKVHCSGVGQVPDCRAS